MIMIRLLILMYNAVAVKGACMHALTIAMQVDKQNNSSSQTTTR